MDFLLFVKKEAVPDTKCIEIVVNTLEIRKALNL